MSSASLLLERADVSRFLVLFTREAAIAGVTAGLVFVALRSRRKGWLLLLAVLPAIAVYVFNPIARVYSNHGLFHTANVYRVIADGVPPTNPLFAGVPLSYPWGHYVLVAPLVRWLDVPPPTIFAAMNVSALVLTLLVIWAIAGHLSDQAVARVFSVALSLFGVTVVTGTAVAKAIQGVTSLRLDSRGIPLVVKFLNVDSMALGVLCFALFLLALVRHYESDRATWRSGLLLAGTVVGVGLLYPLLWVATVVTGGAATLSLLVRRRRRAAVVGGALGGASLAVLPYFLRLAQGRARLALPDLFIDPGNFPRLAWSLLPLGLLVLWQRRALADVLRERPVPFLVLGSGVAALSLLYLLRLERLSYLYDYEYLSLALFCLGLLAGPAFAALYAQRTSASFLVLWALLLPFAADLVPRLDRHRAVLDPFYAEGASLRHADPEQDALYRWIASRTPVDAWFLDTQLSIPVFGRRPLYVGLEDRRLARWSHDWPATGWTESVRVDLEQVNRYPASRVRARQAAAAAFFDPSVTGVPAPARTTILQEAGRHPVFVVARRATIIRKLASDSCCRRVFSRRDVAVYRLLPIAQPAGPPGPRQAASRRGLRWIGGGSREVGAADR